ncbi:hypothetical protein LIER_34793 [Lithospermum erythrorhizon]|uniref:Uncharacterized protein n=1 Tax=Lithospermum erythrorhizon TaxID=34254 RepID=A0AAV3S3C7_LITER
MPTLLVTVLSMFFGNYLHLLFLHLAALPYWKHTLSAFCPVSDAATELHMQCFTATIAKNFENDAHHIRTFLYNRMTSSAVSACMALLLLCPLLAGECEMEDDFDISGDNATHLLAAANAANDAHAIVTMLLEEYDNIFYARGNAILQASLERRKQALHECRLALEHDGFSFPFLWHGFLDKG